MNIITSFFGSASKSFLRMGVRVTPSVYTTLKELDRFCDVMTAIARKGLPKA